MSTIRLWLITLSLLTISTNINADMRIGTGKGITLLSYYGYTQPGILLLKNFYFEYINGDHNIYILAATLGQDQYSRLLINGITDFGNNDTYHRYVGHASYTGQWDYLGTISKNCYVSCQAINLHKPSWSDGVFVLRGFKLSFRGGDRHLERVGIRESDGLLYVDFYDKTKDDWFNVQVQYAYIPREDVVDANVVYGSTDHSSTALKPIPAGNTVLSGFNLDFYPNGEDRRIKEIGVIPTGNEMHVFYGDQAKNTNFSWYVNWVNLR